MERLTERKVGQSYPLKDKAASKVGLFTDYDGFYTYFEAVNRLGAIEDILGDDYDLDRLRELAELTKNIPHVCRFCVGCEMEPKDGHGCDEYDSFVFSTRRLRELMEADRDGRVKILPVSEENTCGSCGHFQRAPGLNSGTCDVQSRYKNKWGQEDVKRGLFTPYQSRRACKKYVGKGVDQHGKDL